jgi:hypothetical protein
MSVKFQHLVTIANREAAKFNGSRDTCVLTSFALHDVLQRLGYDSRPLRRDPNGGLAVGPRRGRFKVIGVTAVHELAEDGLRQAPRAPQEARSGSGGATRTGRLARRQICGALGLPGEAGIGPIYAKSDVAPGASLRSRMGPVSKKFLVPPLFVTFETTADSPMRQAIVAVLSARDAWGVEAPRAARTGGRCVLYCHLGKE